MISKGSEHKFSFGHENLFTSAMGFAQTNACLPGSINAENHGHFLMGFDCSQVIRIYSIGSSMGYVPKIRLPSAVSNMQGYGLIVVSYLKY